MIEVAKFCLKGVLCLFPLISFSQNIVWEQTYSFGNRIVAVEKSDTGYICLGNGGNGIKSLSEVFVIDTSGNLVLRKYLYNDSLISESRSRDMVTVPGENNYYVAGNFTFNGNRDYLAKINSIGDTLWSYEYSPFALFQTTQKIISLRDKSILSVGWQEQAGTQEDVFVRRLDSLGNLMWENMYGMPGNQRGFDITEMLDGSLIVAGSSDGDNLIMRIGFDGRLVHYLQQNMGANTFSIFCSLAFENEMLQTGIPNSASGTYQNLNIFENSTYQLFQRLGLTTIKAYLDQDSNAVIRYFDGTNVRVRYTNSKILSNIWDIDLGSISGDFKSPIGFTSGEINSASVIAYGYSDISNNQNYWLAKISGVGEEWIPDRCAYQPPVAGFEYEYNYPVLTLRDTSSGGLKYLDTVYTWQWNTSVGTSGIQDSLLVFFDSVVNSSIDIELVISNWYGCTDTANLTLNFDPNGITVEQSLEFKVYPNPVSEYLNIEFMEAPEDEVLFELYDIQGVKRGEKLFNERTTNFVFRTSDLPSGLYFYRISSGSQVTPLINGRGKIVKQ